MCRGPLRHLHTALTYLCSLCELCPHAETVAGVSPASQNGQWLDGQVGSGGEGQGSVPRGSSTPGPGFRSSAPTPCPRQRALVSGTELSWGLSAGLSLQGPRLAATQDSREAAGSGDQAAPGGTARRGRAREGLPAGPRGRAAVRRRGAGARPALAPPPPPTCPEQPGWSLATQVTERPPRLFSGLSTHMGALLRSSQPLLQLGLHLPATTSLQPRLCGRPFRSGDRTGLP